MSVEFFDFFVKFKLKNDFECRSMTFKSRSFEEHLVIHPKNSSTMATKFEPKTINEIKANLLQNENHLKAAYVELQNTINTYKLLRDSFKSGKVDVSTDISFQSIYNQFYVMTTVFVSEDFRKTYYKTMAQLKEAKLTGIGDDRINVLWEDHMNVTKKGHNEKSVVTRTPFSFITKLLNIVDESKFPIYDQYVARIFGWKYAPAGNDRVKQYKERYKDICNTYSELLQDPQIKEMISRFKSQFEHEKLYDMRILDIIIWQIGKTEAKKEEKKRKENKSNG